MDMTQNGLNELACFYRRHLVDDVIGFWDQRTADGDYPGFLVPFDRVGKLTGTDKNIWCQSRQTYMFAAMYHDIERRPLWLQLARRGRDMLVNHAHAGGGRWHYLLDREGKVINPAGSLFADGFAIIGLCQYAIASGSDEDLPFIRAAFDTFERNFHKLGFDEFHHFKVDPSLKYHGLRMIIVGMMPIVRQVLGAERVAPLLDQCLHEILHVFAKDDHRVLFEVLGGDGSVLQTDKGQTINPGHTLESMWFCIEEGMYRKDDAVIDRAIQIADWAWENGYDPEHGGLLAFTSPAGGMPPGSEANNWAGETWDSKIWWVHSEALYTTALAALLRNDQKMWQRFIHLHEYTQRYFADHEHGEWYTYLNRDGVPRVDDKGTWIKCAFHVPRNLLKLTLLLEKAAAKA